MTSSGLADMGCAVLKYAVNDGKGRALKTGFNEFPNRFGKAGDVCGIITVDSDDQHLVKGVVRMGRRLSEAGSTGKKQDSFLIYWILFGEFFRYLFSSLSASVINICLFYLLSLWIPGIVGIWIATALARVISSFYNYSVNRSIMFKTSLDMKRSLWCYYML